MSDETAITNLLYRYAESMDAGDLVAAADLFRSADLIVAEGVPPIDADGLLAIWQSSVIIYADGTPRTKHVTTNAIVEVGDDGATASARSYYTVLQQVDDGPLGPIITGRYHDRFAKVAGAWRFTERNYSLVDLVGDLSLHLTMDLGSS